MKVAQSVWEWLSGRKTVLGAFLAVCYVGAVSQGYIAESSVVEYVITVVLGVGLGHKVLKG